MAFVPLNILNKPARTPRHRERGNMLFMILIAVVLIGVLTAAVLNSGNSESSDIDDETLVIKASEVQRYASELERAINYIVRQNARSESDIRFAHPDNHADYGDLAADSDPADQVFHPSGGAASFRAPPAGINNGDGWEFYGGTDAPNVGSDRADLMAVLPNVTQAFCERINLINGQTPTQPLDTGSAAASGGNAGDCVHLGAAGRYNAGQQFYSTANTMDTSTFTRLPAAQGCVQCSGIAGTPYHFYHVIMAR